MDLTPFEPFLDRLGRSGLGAWRSTLAASIALRLGARAHGDLPRWERALAQLPDLPSARSRLDRACVGLQGAGALDADLGRSLSEALMVLHPWRKGPFCIQGVHIDTEWRSDLKWDRVAQAIAPLADRLVLDVGCGNGYHGWRMLGAGARLVMGIDPTLLFVLQWLAINRYLERDDLAVLPLGIEDLPGDLTGFDTVFSMGVLYHRRSPIDHLMELQRLLRPGGELVLETLVLEGEGERLLVPPGRYAAMRNVWFIPTVDALAVWLGRCGFTGIRVVDVTPTGQDEQCSTAWMRFQSLPDHLDPIDSSRTVEGHPAPVRAVLIANRPEASP
ncbi:tRNA 5-methoxyuridine(34)/uridine 5-oxyacetic acid(34) synthase CmoB [Thiocapsa marina]|uniref:tRNA U34 carboxymethyltransferase n=1 Tax=Thiocapsa marina 5811 TaxID=768671 RepID=F9U9R5_9GAMM|nr:tRNA 5-methoxyuridine(34)/uridine 5-oxyacetic acid(34) synthase CmoB [Thiocapsa marina]EGV18863.1 tRNA (mo5U34)-methyltransferase [Thiocapsa marina 5811]